MKPQSQMHLVVQLILSIDTALLAQQVVVKLVHVMMTEVSKGSSSSSSSSSSTSSNKLCGRPPQYVPTLHVNLTFVVVILKVVSESCVTSATSLPI